MFRKHSTEIIRSIQETGYLTEVDSTNVTNLPKLTITNSVAQSFIFDFHGSSALVLDLRITADRRTKIVEFGDLELAGRSWNVIWLMYGDLPIYKFDDHHYPRDIVLNHRVGEQGLVTPEIPMDGFLLGISGASVPRNLRSFCLEAKLAIIDEFATCHWADLLIRFDKDFCVKPTRRKSSLFGPACPRHERTSIVGEDTPRDCDGVAHEDRLNSSRIPGRLH